VSGSLLGIALSGLNGAQGGLVTTGHNIANVNTPGYSRQQTVQASNLPQSSGAGFFGRGVSIETVRRAYDEFLNVQGLSIQASASHWNATLSQLQGMDQLLSDTDVGVTGALNDLFKAVNVVGANPADAVARQSMLSALQEVAGRVQDLDARLQSQGDANERRIASTVAAVNVLGAQIAQLNDRIALASGSTGQPPNDLFDNRDALVADLNKLVRANVVTQSDGSLNVFLGNGQALVVGTRAYALDTAPDAFDATRLSVGLRSGGTLLGFRPQDLEGGELGGLLAFRENTLNPARNALGRIAMVLAANFNQQHKLGVDRNGQFGADVFAAGLPQANAASTNTGTAQLAATVTNYAALTDSDYRVQWDGTNWNVTRLADNSLQSFATLPQTVDGVAISLASGAVATGDTFLVLPTRGGAAGFAALLARTDQIAAAAPMRTSAGGGNTGSGSISAGLVVGPAANANLQQTVTITFTAAGTFDVSGFGTGTPSGVPYTPGAPISYNGWTIRISGAPAAGDTFTIAANTSGSGDNRNAALLAGLQTGTLVGNSATLGEAYGQLLARVGNAAHEADLSAGAQARLLEETQARQASVSGVNLDEEAANLLRYQQAYQAAGKLISVASQLFDALLQLGK
jgi:flagellar hook-associated protein 1 FlgK